MQRLTWFFLCFLLLTAAAVPATPSVWSVCFSADGRWLAAGSQSGTVTLWSLDGKKPPTSWSAHRDVVSSVRFNGKLLLTGSYDHTARLWDVGSHQEQTCFSGLPTEVLSVSCSEDATLFAAGGYSGIAKLWTRDGHEVGTLEGNCVAFLPREHVLASGDKEGNVRLYGASGKLQATWKAHRRVINAVAWNTAGDTLATASGDHTVALWNRSTRQRAGTLSGHRAPVVAVAWSRDGKSLASAGSDGAILWAMGAHPQPRARLAAGWVTCVAFSRDGRWLATGNMRGQVQLWDVASGRLHREMDSP